MGWVTYNKIRTLWFHLTYWILRVAERRFLCWHSWTTGSLSCHILCEFIFAYPFVRNYVLALNLIVKRKIVLLVYLLFGLHVYHVVIKSNMQVYWRTHQLSQMWLSPFCVLGCVCFDFRFDIGLVYGLGSIMYRLNIVNWLKFDSGLQNISGSD